MSIPWAEKVALISINPDVASREDIARLAAELMEALIFTQNMPTKAILAIF